MVVPVVDDEKNRKFSAAIVEYGKVRFVAVDTQRHRVAQR